MGTGNDSDASPPPAASLYQRLGARPGLTAFLRRFYADVRQQTLIGPVFAARVHDWPAHIEKIADFWSGVTGGPAAYSGALPQKHGALGLAPEHFDAWLGLWRRHCQAHLPPREAEELIAAAETFGVRIQWVLQRDRAREGAGPEGPSGSA